MNTQQRPRAFNLFYSYSHRDSSRKTRMEDALSQMKREGLLREWSDSEILPGQAISKEIPPRMAEADILVFLFSPDFIASEECIKEWNRAKELAEANPHIFRIPIIVRTCAWLDLLGEDNLKALPTDAVPVEEYGSTDRAWQDVYEGIKRVVNELRATFIPKVAFLEKMQETEIPSVKQIDLDDIFVFPPLIRRSTAGTDFGKPKDIIRHAKGLLEIDYALIHGPDRSGKTALGRHLLLELVRQSRPVLYVDLDLAGRKLASGFLRQKYDDQFHGDYSLWCRQPEKTLILDNLSSKPGLADFVTQALKEFDRIVVTVSSTVYRSYFRGDSSLAPFEELEIAPLSQTLQEDLIRKRFALMNGATEVADGSIDRIEERVNSIVIDHRIVPRFPFFVLCILQTYETNMPTGMAITSYGHCYHVLIVASLMRAGIGKRDADIDTCFNFAESLAYHTFAHRREAPEEQFNFDAFVKSYNREFIIEERVISRLRQGDYAILEADGTFRTKYMYYFFLGRYFSRGGREESVAIAEMCETTQVEEHFLTLLFTIHHATNSSVIDQILAQTVVSFKEFDVATLGVEETDVFEEIVGRLPKSILSEDSVPESRRRERDMRDQALGWSSEDDGDVDGVEESGDAAADAIHLVFKSNEIMGQVLRNKFGSIKKSRIEQIIEIMADSGLRLVSAMLDDEELTNMAERIVALDDQFDQVEVERFLRIYAFVWVVFNLEHIVGCINVPEIARQIRNVAERKNTPAYDLIAYFAMLGAARKLGAGERDELRRLLKKHEDGFVTNVLSMRVQYYMNTHRSPTRMMQSVCSLLGIKYVPRLVER